MNNDKTLPDLDSQLVIRRATENDSKDIWQWRNDPQTTAMSLNTDEVSWEAHADWYAKSLENPDRFLYIGLSKQKEKIGVCRFDLLDDKAQVSINLNPQFRQQGLSTPLLKAAIQQFFRTNTRVLTATIKRANSSSIKCFEQAGFTFASEDPEYYYYQYTQQSADQAEKLKIIDEIEKIRSGNNINWMNLLRLAFRTAPNDAKELVKKINADDQRISQLFGKLGD